MLSINGLHNFYYLPELHDMRCKAQRICEIIRGRYHRDPLNGDVYMFMSKDQRKVRMIHYERNAYYLHEKSFIKGYKFMKIERKDDVKIAFQDGANVNVDETWLRYHAYNKKRKTYMWCLVNRKARIVIFFYEDTTDDEGVQKHGGRSRNVLKEFLGDAKIKSLQSDWALRPVTVQRKNSQFFGSVKGIQNSAIYNTFIETCRQVGVSFRDYFCRLLRELKKGRTDYENLLPMTICK